MIDATGLNIFGYDHRANFARKNIHGASHATMTWTFDLADRIIGARLPSARYLSYQRDNKGRVVTLQTRPTNTAPWTMLASNIVYEPLSPMKSADLDNGLKLSLDWGSDRRLAWNRQPRHPPPRAREPRTLRKRSFASGPSTFIVWLSKTS
jgi:hypothetical protein